MKEFQAYYRGIYIGRLLINEKGEYLYYVHDEFRKSSFLRRNKIRKFLLTEQLEFGPPIQFFDAVLSAQRLFGGVDSGIAKGVRLKRI